MTTQRTLGAPQTVRFQWKGGRITERLMRPVLDEMGSWAAWVPVEALAWTTYSDNLVCAEVPGGEYVIEVYPDGVAVVFSCNEARENQPVTVNPVDSIEMARACCEMHHAQRVYRGSTISK